MVLVSEDDVSGWITYSKDSLDDVLGLITLILGNLKALDTVGDVIQQRAKEGRLKELVKGDELESNGRSRT
jgi:hypothetical protein